VAQGPSPPHARRRALPVTGGGAGGGAQPLDCTACGACCSSSDPKYITLFAVDEERLDERALALTEVIDGRRVMRMPGRCVALDVSSGRTLCSIYDARPDACRWLVVGSAACLAAREAACVPTEVL
jgi:uncharacterized protein